MIKLELSLEEVNTILRSLGKNPFDEVAGLIIKIKQQGEPQAAEIVNRSQAAQENAPDV